MGRIRTKRYPQYMPPGLRLRTQRSGKSYFYLELGGTPRKEIPLGTDYAQAIQQRSKLLAPALEQIPNTITFEWLAKQYIQQVVSNKNPKQQQLDLKAIGSLHNVLGHLAMHDFFMIDQRALEYGLLDTTSAAQVKHRYTKSVFSHIQKWAAEQQYLKQTHQSSLTHRPLVARPLSRADYMVDELLKNLLVHCEPLCGFAFRLIRLTRARRTDVLSLRLIDLRDGVLLLPSLGSSQRQELSLRDADGKLSILGRLTAELHQFRLQLRPAIKSEQQAPHLYLLSDALGRPLLDADLKEAFAIARTASVKKLIVDKRLDIAKEMQAFQLNELSPLP
jgi:hypothetical protein